MKFDGSDISVGDNVYDVVFGTGTVEHIIEGEDKIVVSFGDRTFTYNAQGFGHFPHKTIFWHDPIAGFTPMKDEHRWAHFCEIRNSVAQTVWDSKRIKSEG